MNEFSLGSIRFPNGFAPTKAVETMFAAHSFALTMRKPVLVYGAPDTGKSAAALLVAEMNNAALVKIGQSTKDPVGLYFSLVEAFGIYPSSTGRQRLGMECFRLLQGVSRPLIVDEYQNLETRTLRELLHLQEECGFPLIAVGNDSRISRISKKDELTYQQIDTRWAFRSEILQPSEADFFQLAILFRVQDMPAFKLVGAFGAGRGFREVQNVLAIAADKAPTGPVTTEHLSAVICGLYGVDDAAQTFETNIASLDVSYPISKQTPERKRA